MGLDRAARFLTRNAGRRAEPKQRRCPSRTSRLREKRGAPSPHPEQGAGRAWAWTTPEPSVMLIKGLLAEWQRESKLGLWREGESYLLYHPPRPGRALAKGASGPLSPGPPHTLTS